MRAKLIAAALVAAVVAVASTHLAHVAAGDKEGGEKSPRTKGGIRLEAPKIEEGDTKASLGEPRYGYIGQLGTFEAAMKGTTGEAPVAQFVVHQYPHQERIALGCTKLKYMGTKRLGNVDGWVFQTEWDGKHYPSKLFLSAERVYFGGGVIDYIAADYRTETGWAWKYLPLRRMPLATGTSSAGR